MKRPRGGVDPGNTRKPAVRVKTAKGRKLSSKLWLQRQLNDPFVAAAQAAGYRSRAAFKLAELDERFHLLKRGARVVDLGAAPGGWSQLAASHGAIVVAVDVLPIVPIPGVVILQGDMERAATAEKVRAALRGEADVVMSDMAAPATGHRATDHIRVVALAEAALAFAEDVLRQGGAFIVKVYQGGAERTLLDRLRRDFAELRHVKPQASRKESAELYLVARGFRGG